MIIKRNIILFLLIISFFGTNYILTNIIIENKTRYISELEKKHKDVNEKYITAQILSQQLENVYNIFENNLAFSKKDKINEEASMDFLKSLTDIMEKNEIDLTQIIPGKKIKKGSLIKIPYVLQFECDYEKLGKLIIALENNNRLILIDNIYLKNNVEKIKMKNTNDMDYLNQDIEMKIYTVTINKAKIL